MGPFQVSVVRLPIPLGNRSACCLVQIQKFAVNSTADRQKLQHLMMTTSTARYVVCHNKKKFAALHACTNVHETCCLLQMVCIFSGNGIFCISLSLKKRCNFRENYSPGMLDI